MNTNDSIEAMNRFIKEMNNHGKTSQNNLWNMTGTVFGIFIASLSIIATLKPDCNEWIATVSMISAIVGMICVWKCFHLQTQYYTTILGFCNDNIQPQEQEPDYAKVKEEGLSISKKQERFDTVSNGCLIITALGLVLTIII